MQDRVLILFAVQFNNIEVDSVSGTGPQWAPIV
jgi:hypothetical protein